MTDITNQANDDETPALQFSNWLKKLREEQPQADYWFKSMELDLLILQFVKSFRTADLALYVETLHSLMPWIFVLDHTHYARTLCPHYAWDKSQNVHFPTFREIKCTNR